MNVDERPCLSGLGELRCALPEKKGAANCCRHSARGPLKVCQLELDLADTAGEVPPVGHRHPVPAPRLPPFARRAE